MKLVTFHFLESDVGPGPFTAHPAYDTFSRKNVSSGRLGVEDSAI